MERVLILVLAVGVAQGYYVFSRESCSTGQVRCPRDGSCIYKHQVCDGSHHCNNYMDEDDCERRRAECAGGDLATCEVRQRSASPPWDGLYLGPGARTAVNQTEVSMFAARVALKLSQLTEHTYLEAERIINGVIYKAQRGILSTETTLAQAPHQGYLPHSTTAHPDHHSRPLLNLTDA